MARKLSLAAIAVLLDKDPVTQVCSAHVYVHAPQDLCQGPIVGWTDASYLTCMACSTFFNAGWGRTEIPNTVVVERMSTLLVLRPNPTPHP
jgi:hypothetical protein